MLAASVAPRHKMCRTCNAASKDELWCMLQTSSHSDTSAQQSPALHCPTSCHREWHVSISSSSLWQACRKRQYHGLPRSAHYAMQAMPVTADLQALQCKPLMMTWLLQAACRCNLSLQYAAAMLSITIGAMHFSVAATKECQQCMPSLMLP